MGAGQQSEGKAPDFLIVGAMKAGTTALFNWLGGVDGIEMPSSKELRYFCGENWDRGRQWYESHFAGLQGMTGEASPCYSDPGRVTATVHRIVTEYPDVKVVYVLRDPITRARSHYQHEVQRGREGRPFPDAAAPDSPYVQLSRYSVCLEEYRSRFGDEQLLVKPFDSLFGESERGWEELLNFLGVNHSPRPSKVFNETRGKRQFTPLMLRLWESGLIDTLGKAPSFVRRVGKRLLTSDSPAYHALLMSSHQPLLPASAALLAQEEELVHRCG